MNPFSAITEVESYLEEHWTPHWMAVTAVMDGVGFHVLNVYAPTVKPEREAVFRELHTHFAHLEEPLWVGGDFNSTQLRSLDRSFSTGTDTHHSRALASLLLDRALTDVAEEAIAEAVTEEQVGHFRSLHHTFFYRLPDGSPASSRLNRWYVSTQMYAWVRKMQVVIPGPGSDHNGVLLLICNPRWKRRRKGIAPAYPVPLYAVAEAGKIATRILDSFELALAKMPNAEMGTQRHAEVWARKWDELKYEIRAAYRSTRRECKRKVIAGHQQRLRHLNQALTCMAGRLAANGSRVDTKLTTSDDVLKMRADIANKKLLTQNRRGTLLLVSHSTKKPTSAAFFRRISTQHLDNTVLTLVDHDGHVYENTEELPNIMAEEWRQTIASHLEQIDWTLPRLRQFVPQAGSGLEHTGDAPTALEVATAIKSCKKGKAPGPDGLGNDWYRAHAARLEPVMTRLFALWTEHSIFPASFKTAHILGLKKKRDAVRPLDFRPIALLNTDYKVYTRVFATRTRGKASALVHDMQNGFVPGRTIHTTLDAYYAVKALVAARKLPATVLVLLLDFAKAYDSLRRDFLLWVLKNYGFPPKFLEMVEALHHGTSCQFLVNGFASRVVGITTGIRQGCPLAPLLFILALDPLYRSIENSQQLVGLQIGEGTRKLKVGGYADDTALHLSSVAEIPTALDILAEFGAVSGLRVNVAKSTGVHLTLQETEEVASHHGIPILRNSESCRYLGLQVGCSNMCADNWSRFLQATAGRVALAIAKTHTVLQRVQIAKAVIVSKILFVARHEWPSRTTITQLHKMIKRFMWGTRGERTRRAWVNDVIAGLDLSDGGLGIPVILQELQVMSAKVVADWAADSRAPGAIFGELLLDSNMSSPTFITPHHMTGVPTSRYHSTLRSSGAEVLRAAHQRTATNSLRLATTAAAPAVFACINAARWRDERLHVCVDDTMQRLTRQLARVHKTEFGRPDMKWLQHLDVSTPGAL